MSTTKETKLNISQIEHKLPTPFLQDVNYKNFNGEIRTIKGFIGTVKNTEAVDDESYNYLQPFQLEDGRFLNPQISLSTFFVDKHNVIYGDFFRGTIGANTFTQLFAIPQQEIIPIFHKKQDIQVDIVGSNKIIEKSGQNNEIIRKAKDIAAKHYNLITNTNNTQDNSNTTNNPKPKLKCFSDNENVIETVFNKYLKFNDKALYNMFTNNGKMHWQFSYKHKHISNFKTITLDGNVLFNVEHDELLAVPKDKEFKTHFNCEIITRMPTNIEQLKQILGIQAKSCYPYVIVFQTDKQPPKLQYMLMSEYIRSIKDEIHKNIETLQTNLASQESDDVTSKDWYINAIQDGERVIKDIDKDEDLKAFQEYEQKQIDYIYQQKSKTFACSVTFLKQLIRQISKTDNVAEQLNYLINYENKKKKEVEQQKSFAKKLKIEPEDLWHNQKHKKFNDMLQKIIINNTLGISVKEFNEVLEEKFNAKTDLEKMSILENKSKLLKEEINNYKEFKYDPYGHLSKLEKKIGQMMMNKFRTRKIKDIYKNKINKKIDYLRVKSKIGTSNKKKLKNTAQINMAKRQNKQI